MQIGSWRLWQYSYLIDIYVWVVWILLFLFFFASKNDINRVGKHRTKFNFFKICEQNSFRIGVFKI